MTDQDLILACRVYQTRREMREVAPHLVRRVYKRKLSSAAFAHMKKERHYVSECDGSKRCSSCGMVKPVAEFHLAKRGGQRRRGECIKCSSYASARWASENYERSREIQNASARRYPEKVRSRVAAKRKANPEAFAARDMLKRVLAITGAKKSGRTEAEIGYTAKELRDHIQAQFRIGMSWDNWGEWHIDHIEPVMVMVKRGVTDPSKINALSNLRPLWASENLRRRHDGS